MEEGNDMNGSSPVVASSSQTQLPSDPTSGISMLSQVALMEQQQQQMQDLQPPPPNQHHQLTSQQQHHHGAMMGNMGVQGAQATSGVSVTSACDDSSDGMNQHYTFTEETNVQMADSNSPKQTFVPCKVCGDKASGYHYGVTSCEGCKGFFRRSIQKQIEYRCLRDGKCLVIRLNRNRCQYCRFKKCLAVGMSRDSVRYGRVPKRSKSQEEQRVTTTEGTQEQTALESKQLAIYDIILTISQAHHANCVLTEDKIKAIVKKPFSPMPIKLESEVGNGCASQAELDSQRLLVFTNLAVIITASIQRVVEFAKRVPGFHELSQDDQLILIKAGFFEIWLTRLTRMFNNDDNTVTFGDGSVITKHQLQVVFTEELAAAMFDFAQNFSQLRLNDTEMGLFTGVVLATADRQGLTNVKGVELIQDKLIEALKLQISRNHSTEPHMFANILMKLPELRMLGSKHGDQLAWYRVNWSQLRLPPLFAEIYDIPKSEEDFDSSVAS